ncbi:MAG: excinuclease ABC subunit UvrC [Bacteroidetes bacterium]|nr:excinuclease ABC subunit UvrC [Bacteroidota bacterium]MBK9541782.1 excinuclease ABC subunit UvrC [Bacteroidota bacterium]MBP6402921.1 excinuclease ABC subunit UvrC [Bacteroidia bacterium]MBP6648063.1 excinuclease ABC subunit UvrC [Bacteroidia bacterium]
MATEIQNILSTLEDRPGVYQFYDKDGLLLYVGKAKSLKKRVSSYFQKERHENGKTTVLVRKIADIKTIVVDTELDALLLENSLIKKHQPRYNVSLKDDKTYPWICIKNERFPRIFITRRVIKDGSEYFGPFTPVKMIHTLLELTSQLYKLRNCNLILSEENIAKKKFKVCLEYHIGNCKGPCEGLQRVEEYDQSIKDIRQILKGNINTVIQHLKVLMNNYSEKFEFEEAHAIKEKIELLEKYKVKSVVVNPTIHNTDVFSIITDEDAAYVNFLRIMNGSIIQGHTIELKKKLEETEEELLEIAIADLRTRFLSDAAEILVPISLNLEMEGVTFTVPKIGDKKHLLTLSETNVKNYIREKQLQLEKQNPENRTMRVLEQMKKDLRLTELPRRIECFDNSNIQGSYPVAAMSVFLNGKPAKKEYRHYNIKTVEGPDDFASMEEVIFRRYRRMLDEAQELPQLIVIDGGKGQLSSAMISLDKLGLHGKIAVIGIAKRLEEIYYPGDTAPLYIDKKSETLRIIQQLRDEVHRFGITHHRKRREKGTIKTELSEIKGIGEATAQALLIHFKSVKRIKEATAEELEAVIGKSRAEKVITHFRGNEE